MFPPVWEVQMISRQPHLVKVGRVGLGFCVTLSAFLVISIQPAAVGWLLPGTGGHPTLWHGAQAVFQIVLLIGYWLAGKLSDGSKSSRYWLAFAFVCGSVGSLLSDSDRLGTTSMPDALLHIASHFGLPLLALSTVSIQAQLLWSRLTGGSSPYWLFALGNTGSLLAVVMYPFVIEPNVDVSVQLTAWRYTTAVLLGAVGCFLLIGRTAGHDVGMDPHPAMRPPLGGIARWLLGGAVPVGLSLACTSYLSVELGSHPAVWMAPFGVYLATMLLSFTALGFRVTKAIGAAAPLAMLSILVLLLGRGQGGLAMLVVHLLALTILLSRWHSWLFEQRPTIRLLPAFYQCVAAGGAASGLALAFLAPRMLPAIDPQVMPGWLRALAIVSPPESLALYPLYADCASGCEQQLAGTGARADRRRRARRDPLVGRSCCIAIPITKMAAVSWFCLSCPGRMCLASIAAPKPSHRWNSCAACCGTSGRCSHPCHRSTHKVTFRPTSCRN